MVAQAQQVEMVFKESGYRRKNISTVEYVELQLLSFLDQQSSLQKCGTATPS